MSLVAKMAGMTRILPVILIALGALLLTPLVFAAVLIVTGPSMSVAIVAPEALILLALAPIAGLALIWLGLRALRPR